MIDKDRIKDLIKPECTKCNVMQKHKTKTKCNGCNFSYGSDCFTTGNKFFEIGLGGLRKHHFYYLLYHPELNWKFPELPDKDNKGRCRENYERWQWEIHHNDHDPTNDSRLNLYLMLKTEHDSLHQIRKNFIDNPMNRIDVRIKASKSAKKRQSKLYKEGNHNFQKDGAREKNAKNKSDLYKEGKHPFQKYNDIRIQKLPRGDNHYLRQQQLKIKEYIEQLKDDVVLTDELAVRFGYKNLETFRDPVKKVLKRYLLPFTINVIRETKAFNGRIVGVRLERIK